MRVRLAAALAVLAILAATAAVPAPPTFACKEESNTISCLDPFGGNEPGSVEQAPVASSTP